MKKLILLFIGISFVSVSFCQTLFTYGNHAVPASEFLAAYNKNKTASSDSAGALRQYLDLYVKFKLKVQAARDLHLDTLPSLQADLQNFRSQIQDNYLNDKKETTKLTDEAFSRSQKDIHAVYFFVAAREDGDTAKAYQAIHTVYGQLQDQKLSEEQIIARASTGSVTVQKSDLGYITVFTLPYEFENIIYGLKPGQSAPPYRTKKGWYIFKNAGERHAVGKITVAQILFAIPQGYSQQKQSIHTLADSVYAALMNGADFGAMAKQFSDDRSTYYDGGRLPEFGTAKYDSIFEDHAFALQKDGEISRPFETGFGFHILKRLSASPVPATQNNDQFMSELKEEVSKDSRIGIAKQKFVEEIIPVIGFKQVAVNKQDLWAVTDSSLIKNKNIRVNKVDENTTLFTCNNHASVKVRDWILYIRNLNLAYPPQMHGFYETLYPKFADASAVSNYGSRLEEFSPAFRSQVREFSDGNMLFEVMQRNVWGKASSDSAGLQKYYNQHKEKYLWGPSAEAILFSCSGKTDCDAAIRELKEGKTWKEILSENPAHLQADSGRYELGQIPVVERTHFTPGLITLPVINRNDGTAVFASILALYPGNQQRSFDDARGLVINDYQNYLEQNWVARLEKKYPVKINEKIFQQLEK